MKNTILLTFDSIRADHCSWMGYDRETTPNLSSLAEDGVNFENATAVAPRTLTSMSAAFTGEPLLNREEAPDPSHSRRHLSRYETIAERFSEMGYTTGAFCTSAFASQFYGFDTGFDHFEDFMFDKDIYQELFSRLGDSKVMWSVRNLRNFVRRQETFKTWDTYVDDIEEWVNKQDEPFFLWIFALDPHIPYLTPRQYRQWSNLWKMYYYNWKSYRFITDESPEPTERVIQNIKDIYDDSIYFGDQFVGELQSRLAERAPAIVVHSDHGESFFERGLYGHYYPELYQENLHVPLVAGNVDSDQDTVSRPVSLTELPNLLMNVARDRNILLDESPRPVVSTDYDGMSHKHMIAVRFGDFKFIYTDAEDGTLEECYDLSTDPGESNNLVGESEGTELLRWLVDRERQTQAEKLAISEATTKQLATAVTDASGTTGEADDY